MDRIRRNPDQPRKDFTAEDLRELALSIDAVSLIDAIDVRLINDEHYEAENSRGRMTVSSTSLTQEVYDSG